MAKASKKSPEEKLRVVLTVTWDGVDAADRYEVLYQPAAEAAGSGGAATRSSAACGCRKLCRIWSGGISVLVDESATAGRFHGLEVTVWLVWWVGGDGWSLVE